MKGSFLHADPQGYQAGLAALAVVMGMLALGNALLGMWLMWALMRDEPAAAPSQDTTDPTAR